MGSFRRFLEGEWSPRLRVYRSPHPHLSRTFHVKVVDGKVLPIENLDDDRRHYTIQPSARSILLQRLSPFTPEFHTLIAALRPYYPDVDDWQVEIYYMAGHMKPGNNKWNRTVGYYLRHAPVDLDREIPAILFTGTSTNVYLDGIRQNGLLPRRLSGSLGSYGAQNFESLSNGDRVYLSVHPDAATRTAAEQAANRHGGRPLILKVSTKDLDPSRFGPDEDSDAETARDSVRRLSTLSYEGSIPPEAVTPFLIGKKSVRDHMNVTDWSPYKDPGIEEHPMTVALRRGEVPYHNDPAYYIFKDAGIIGNERSHDDRGFGYERTVKKRGPSDEEVKSLLRNGSWAIAVRAILRDLDKGYSGVLYGLKGMTVPEDLTPEEKRILRAMMQSGLVKIFARRFELSTWEAERHAIPLAKILRDLGVDYPTFFRLVADITRRSR